MAVYYFGACSITDDASYPNNKMETNYSVT